MRCLYLFATVAFIVDATKNITLATFDGARSSTLKWHVVNDPLMGGQSVSTFDVKDGFGVFDGEVKIVPSLGAAGFCNLETEAGQTFPDITGAEGLLLSIRNTGTLTGLEVTISTKNSGTTFRHGDYSGNTTIVNDGKLHDVFVPFSEFKCEWRGQVIRCPEIQTQLAQVEALGVSFGQDPNVPGKFHIEIKSIGTQ